MSQLSTTKIIFTNTLNKGNSDILEKYLDFDACLYTFKKGCDDVLDRFLNQPRDPYTGPWPSSIYATEGTPSNLKIVKTKMYAKLEGRQYDGSRSYTFAMVDLESGDVYRPSSSLDGTLNRKKAIARGNIFDQYNGLRSVYSGGPQAIVDSEEL